MFGLACDIGEFSPALSRPDIPPLFFIAAPALAACGLCLNSLRIVTVDACLILCACAACLMVVFALSLAHFGLNRIVLVGIGVGMGMLLAGQAAVSHKLTSEYVLNAAQTAHTFQIVEDVSENNFGAYSTAIAHDNLGHTFKVRVNLPEGQDVKCWDVFSSTCTIASPSDAAASYYWRKDCVGSISPYRINFIEQKGLLRLLSGLRSSCIDLYKANGSVGSLFMRSIAFGDRQDLFNTQFYLTVRRVGLAHIVAVSGAHLSICIAALSSLLGKTNMRKALSVCIQALMCICFVLFTGSPRSAMRAAAMSLCLLASYFFKRRSFALNALSVCIVTFLLFDPFIALSTSFLLSACATCGIVLFAGYFSVWFQVLFSGHAKKLCDLVGMTLSAVLATLPLSASLFGQFSFIAPLSNIVAAPFFAFLVVGGLLCAFVALMFPPAQVLVGLICESAQVFCDCLEVLGRIPFAGAGIDASWQFLSMGVAAISIALFHFWPQPSKRHACYAAASILLATLISIFLFPAFHGCEIIMLDVGQGDAFVLRSGKQALLIDTGNNDTAVLKALARHNINHLDAVLITHADDDHCGALPSVCSFVEVDRILVAQDLLSSSATNCVKLRNGVAADKLVGLRVGDTFTWGCFSASVLSPSTFIDDGANEDSVVISVEADVDGDHAVDASAFFCGDAEQEVLAKLNVQGVLEQIDILKVGHHGSAGAFSEEQLEILSPKIALISVGEHNRYGHPTQETLSLLENANIPYFRTDKNGDVVCKIDAHIIEVVCNR